MTGRRGGRKGGHALGVGRDWRRPVPAHEASRDGPHWRCASGPGAIDGGTGGRGQRRPQQLASYRYLPATKADLLRRLGRHEEAIEAYRAALALTDNATERAVLAERLG